MTAPKFQVVYQIHTRFKGIENYPYVGVMEPMDAYSAVECAYEWVSRGACSVEIFRAGKYHPRKLELGLSVLG